MIRSVPRPAWFILLALVVLADLDQILGFVARQADRVIGTFGHYSGRIAIAAGLIGLAVHLFMPHAEHGWKIVERSAILVFGAALIPILYPLLQVLAGGAMPRLLSAVVNVLAGIGG